MPLLQKIYKIKEKVYLMNILADPSGQLNEILL